MPFVFKILENCFHSPGASVAVSVPPVSTPPKSPSKKWSTSVTGPDESPPTLATATFDRFCRGAMGIAGRPWRLETGVTPSVSFSIPARRQAFWPDGDLGSSNRPFPSTTVLESLTLAPERGAVRHGQRSDLRGVAK